MSDLHNALVDLVDELTQPTQHRTPRHRWDTNRSNRNKIRLPDHVAVVPGLLTQLALRAFPLSVDADAAPGARQVPQSKEPGSPAAIAAHLDIAMAVARWADRIDGRRAGTLASRVRGLLGAASTQPSGVQRELVYELRGWLARCEHVLGLRDADPTLPVPCPDLLCQSRTLRVDLAERTVRCMACGARWAERETETTGSLARLGDYVNAYRQYAATAAEAVRAEERRRAAAWTFTMLDDGAA